MKEEYFKIGGEPFSNKYPYIFSNAADYGEPDNPEFIKYQKKSRLYYHTLYTNRVQEIKSDMAMLDSHIVSTLAGREQKIKFSDIENFNFNIRISPNVFFGLNVGNKKNHEFQISIDSEFPYFFYQSSKFFSWLCLEDPKDAKGFKLISDLEELKGRIFKCSMFQKNMRELMTAYCNFGSPVCKRPLMTQNKIVQGVQSFFTSGIERWMIAHEMGHCLLDHHNKDKANVTALEYEADAFASLYLFCRKLENKVKTLDGSMFDDQANPAKNFGMVILLPLFCLSSLVYFRSFAREIFDKSPFDIETEGQYYPSIIARLVVLVRAMKGCNVSTYPKFEIELIAFVLDINDLARNTAKKTKQLGVINSSSISKTFKSFEKWV